MTSPEDRFPSGESDEPSQARSVTTDHIDQQVVRAFEYISAADMGEKLCQLCEREGIGVPVFMSYSGEANYTSKVVVDPSIVPNQPEVTDVHIKMNELPKTKVGHLLFSRELNKVLFISNSDVPGFFCEFRPIPSSDKMKPNLLAAEARYSKFMGQYFSGQILFVSDHPAHFGQHLMSQLPGHVVISYHTEYTGDAAGLYEQMFLEIFGQVKLEGMKLKDLAQSLQTLLAVLNSITVL